MLKMSRQNLCVALGVAVVALTAACSANPTSAPTGVQITVETRAAPASTITAPPATIVPAPTFAPTLAANTATCPKETADTQLLFNPPDGYCLLYPKDFTLQHPASNVYTLIGPALDTSSNPLSAQMSITNEGAAAGQTLNSLAEKFWRDSRAKITRNTIKLGGENAIVAENVLAGEAAWTTKQIVTIHNRIVYRLVFAPVDVQFPKAIPDMRRLSDAVVSSFTFVPAQSAVAATPGKSIQAKVAVASIYLRSGPGTVHSKLALYGQGTNVTVLGKAPGDDWVSVKTPDGKTGWMAIEFLGEVPLASVPTSQPTESQIITGKVVDTTGSPVDRISIAVWQDSASGQLRTDGNTGKDGIFYAYLPKESQGTWTVGVVGVGCKSRIVDANCKYPGSFNPIMVKTQLPQTQAATITYDATKPESK